MRSLRSRLMIGTAVATLAIFVAAAAALCIVTRRALVREFDDITLAEARAIASMTEIEGHNLIVEDVQELPEFHRARHPDYFEIWTLDGTVVAKSKSLEDHDLPRIAADRVASSKATAISLSDSSAGRQIGLSFQAHVDAGGTIPPNIAPGLVVAVARETYPLDHVLVVLYGLLSIVCGVAVVAMLGVIAMVIRQALRPLNDLAGQISRIDEANLSAHLNESAVPRELAPIVNRLNELLGRLNSAFTREKSFTADAAHELRTPLAGLESALEVCIRRPRTTERYETVVRDCLDVVRGMHSMVESLLMLARADAHLVKVLPTTLSLDQLLHDAWQRHEQRALDRQLQIDWQVQDDLAISTDREKLLSVLHNLFDNAVHYADAGGRISITANRADQTAIIRIANSGSPVSADDAAHVFDRFWRADPSRSDNGANCGLGMSVCQKLVALLGGSIAVAAELNSDFVVTISLPATNTPSLSNPAASSFTQNSLSL